MATEASVVSLGGVVIVRIGKVLPTVTIVQIEVNAYYVSVFTYLKWIICM